jgi:metalloendopeptidase OMA1, mitochondrial
VANDVNCLQLAEEARKELRQEFGGKILPPNHALTRHVHRIVSRILEHNNLGTLKTTPSPSAGWFSGGFDDPYIGHGDDRPVGSGDKTWELMVVKDDSVVNAMASFGAFETNVHSCLRPDIRKGTVIVFTGILPIARDEEGLAAILGHGEHTIPHATNLSSLLV